MNILLSVASTLAVLLVGWNTLSFNDLNYLSVSNMLKSTKFGAFTEVLSTDQLSNFPTLYNANLAKSLEVGTTSVASITTLSGLTSASSLATVGTITSGTWSGTAIAVAKGGTGTTTPSTYQVILGNGANGLTVASSTGTSGQLLTSNGAGAYPSWGSPSVDTAINYSWTGTHNFSKDTGIGSSTPTQKLSVVGNAFITGTTTIGNLNVASGTAQLNGLQANFPSSQSTGSGLATTSELLNDGTGNLSWQIPFDMNATSTNPGYIGTQVINHALGRVPRFITINMVTIVDIAGTDESVTSVGFATSTKQAAGGDYSGQRAIMINRGDVNMFTRSARYIMNASDSGGDASVNAGISDWTATTFTINWDDNVTGGTEAARKFIWRVE